LPDQEHNAGAAMWQMGIPGSLTFRAIVAAMVAVSLMLLAA
jgi:hypothetical protein